ncbi:hypothetical protein [Roseibium alexandrii]|uniref:hypothetical protein n=1 Tax=Roseibium alexandrii TaxID=388408 RepID=UPI003752D1B7
MAEWIDALTIARRPLISATAKGGCCSSGIETLRALARIQSQLRFRVKSELQQRKNPRRQQDKNTSDKHRLAGQTEPLVMPTKDCVSDISFASFGLGSSRSNSAETAPQFLQSPLQVFFLSTPSL